jgi:LAGLIDADG DNA endonuclease family
LISLTRFFHSTISIFVKRISKAVKDNFKLDSYLKQVLIGTILGDVHMRRFSDKSNVRIIFRQGSINTSYLLHLYNLFQEYVLTPPKISTVKDKKKN